jgi:hypothetical protein
VIFVHSMSCLPAAYGGSTGNPGILVIGEVEGFQPGSGMVAGSQFPLLLLGSGNFTGRYLEFPWIQLCQILGKHVYSQYISSYTLKEPLGFTAHC